MRTPGNGSSVVHAPPTRSRLSSTSTRCPARARYAAHANPLCPAPTIIASHRRAASSRTGAGNPIFPSTSAVGEDMPAPLSPPLEIPGDIDDENTLIPPEEEKKLEQVRPLVVEQIFPPVTNHEFG